MYVKIKRGTKEKWVPARKASVLPKEVLDLINED